MILNDGVTERIVTSVFNSPHCHLGISPRGLADVFRSNLLNFLLFVFLQDGLKMIFGDVLE